MLYLSIRTAFCDTLVKRLAKFDEQVGVPAGVELGFRSYREKAFHRGRKHDSFRAKQADRALVQCPSLIISLESLHRLASARSLEGVLLVPQYDVLVMDEIMESHAIFHGSTMEEVLHQLELLQSIASNVYSVIGADADIKDWVVLPFLQDLTNGQAFVKVSHQAKTLPRRYVHYSEHAHWRKELLNALRAGKKIVVACNIKKEVLSIINDPDIVALGLPMQAVHQESTGEERQAYVAQVSNWSSLSLFVYSPVISSGVDFNLEHFDQAFWFASDNSTTAVRHLATQSCAQTERKTLCTPSQLARRARRRLAGAPWRRSRSSWTSASGASWRPLAVLITQPAHPRSPPRRPRQA